MTLLTIAALPLKLIGALDMNTPNVKEINQAIMFGTWTNVELNSMMDAIKWARSNLARRVKSSIMLGDHVQFTNTKTGRVMQGTVNKIAIKYVTVSTAQGLWKVPASMLSHVEELEAA